MGTNYYAVSKKENFTETELSHLADDLDDDEVIIHLGKSSGGWRFSLHVYPEIGLMSWNDILTIAENSVRILDEYEEEVTLDFFIDVVTDRKWGRVSSDEDYMIDKHGLRIHPIDNSHCIGNGGENETFDYIKGNFS
jgi:hypothetical protein